MKEAAAGVKKFKSGAEVRRRFKGFGIMLGEEEPENDEEGANNGRSSATVAMMNE